MEAILILLGTESRRLVENGSDQCRKKHELFQVPSLSDHSRQPLASFRRISIIGVNHHDKRCLVFRQKSIGSFQLFVLLFCFLRLPKCNNPNHCNPQLQSEAHPHILLVCRSTCRIPRLIYVFCFLVLPLCMRILHSYSHKGTIILAFG